MTMFMSSLLFGQGIEGEDRPNILWITTEDQGPHLGAYGDSYAHTPSLDSFASRSLRYDVAWSDAPVCAPARTALITGVYPTSTGGQHMRSDVQLPSLIRKYPALLRAEGYYTTNNSKEDYNVSGHGQAWDESSPEAHYENRDEGQPFFAVFNFTQSHESRIRDRTDLPYHDPEQAPVPPYHPDTPEVRRDWAQYYHGISQIDRKAGEVLEQLRENGLEEETIVFFYGDHGSGMPRHKRWPYNSGLQVPLMIHVPDKYRHLAPQEYRPGGSTNRPVAFVDLAPTLLSLIGTEPPEWMQGRPIMGRYEAEPRQYLYGFRGRMDERYDKVRSVRNDRYIYIRNYMPHKIYGQYLAYMWLTETTRVWEQMYQNGELSPPQTYFWEPKPAEELYDLQNDPHEIDNLAGSGREEHRRVLEELRRAHRTHVLETRDAGLLPEAEMHRRAKVSGLTIYEMAHDDDLYPLERILAAAQMAAGRDAESVPGLLEAFRDEDPAVRYWAAMGILVRGQDAFDRAALQLRWSLNDENPSVRIAAAEALIRYGTGRDESRAVKTLLELVPADENGAFVSIAALNVLADLDEEILAGIRPALRQMEVNDPALPPRPNDYVHRLVESIMNGEK
ncbi:MAG: sulfatase-like hydrolase/transferase [Balneolaceae bacterium]